MNLNKKIFLVTFTSLVFFFLFTPHLFPYDLAKRVQSFTLKNGLRLLILERHLSPTISIYIRYRAGAADEADGKTGTAHLLEHMMFKGTKTIGTRNYRREVRIIEELEFMAASLHTSINRDSGVFSLSCLSKDLDKVLDIFSRILMKPFFEEAKLTLAKDLKIGELRRISDDPQKLAFREFGRLIHEGSPRGRLVTRDSINSIHREDLFRHHDLFYHPDRVMISISGDIDLREAESIINRCFGSWKSANAQVEVPPPPHPQKGGFFFLPKDVPQSVIMFGWIAPSKNNPQFSPFEIIDFITGSGGFRSKMFQEIRTDRGLAYSTGSFYTAKSEYGLFGAYALTKSESTIEVISLIRGIITDITEKPIPPDDLKKSKKSILNSFIFSFTSADKIAFQQMMVEYEDLPKDYLITYRNNIEKVAIDDLRKAALHLDPNRAIILIVGNDAIFNAIAGSFEKVQRIEGSF